MTRRTSEVIKKVQTATKSSDAYVHAHPWQMIGIAAGVAAALGVALALRFHRR